MVFDEDCHPRVFSPEGGLETRRSHDGRVLVDIVPLAPLQNIQAPHTVILGHVPAIVDIGSTLCTKLWAKTIGDIHDDELVDSISV